MDPALGSILDDAKKAASRTAERAADSLLNKGNDVMRTVIPPSPPVPQPPPVAPAPPTVTITGPTVSVPAPKAGMGMTGWLTLLALGGLAIYVARR